MRRPIAELAREQGLDPSTVRKRVRDLGWSLERALGTRPGETRMGKKLELEPVLLPRDERCPGAGERAGACGERAGAGPSNRYCEACWAWLAEPVGEVAA